MKIHIILFAVTALFITSCAGSGKKKNRKVSKQELFGDWEGRTYRNPLFNFKVDMPESWNYDTNYFQTGFGGDVISASKNVGEYDEMIFNIELIKTNPFERNPTPLSEFKDETEALVMLFGKENVITEPLKKSNIGGSEYILQKTTLYDEYDTTYLLNYMRVNEGYYISISGSYLTKEGETEVLDLINSIKKLK